MRNLVSKYGRFGCTREEKMKKRAKKRKENSCPKHSSVKEKEAAEKSWIIHLDSERKRREKETKTVSQLDAVRAIREHPFLSAPGS